MNYENLNKVIDWLERGAPEVVFSMHYALTAIDDTDLKNEDDPLDEGFHTLALTEQAKVRGGCGSVCCIAGAAAQFAGMKPDEYDAWTDVQTRALNYFGIGVNESTPWMLPVFDPEWAPDNCTPRQAAEALKRWAEHADKDITFNPWTEEDE